MRVGYWYERVPVAANLFRVFGSFRYDDKAVLNKSKAITNQLRNIKNLLEPEILRGTAAVEVLRMCLGQQFVQFSQCFSNLMEEKYAVV
jgi:hypothetical protein